MRGCGVKRRQSTLLSTARVSLAAASTARCVSICTFVLVKQVNRVPALKDDYTRASRVAASVYLLYSYRY